MRKLVSAVAALLLGLNAFAGPGIVGGVSNADGCLDLKTATQFHVGLTYNWLLAGGFGLQPSILYTVKNAPVEELKTNLKMGFIEIPLQVQWGLNFFKKNLRIYAFAEPFVGFNLSTIEINSSTTIGEIGGHFEYGLGAGLGVMLFKHIQLSGGYQWNFNDISVSSMSVGKPRGARISLALIF